MAEADRTGTTVCITDLSELSTTACLSLVS